MDKDNGFEWVGEYDISADELLSGDSRGQKSRQAKEFLLNILSAGKIPQKKIEEEAQKHGIVMKTLRNVKRELNIKSKKEETNGSGYYQSKKEKLSVILEK